jgi:hypothetical protein
MMALDPFFNPVETSLDRPTCRIHAIPSFRTHVRSAERFGTCLGGLPVMRVRELG